MALMLYFYLTLGSSAAAFGATLLVGWLKELYDARFGTGYCWFDIAANTVGALMAWLLLTALAVPQLHGA